MDRALLIILGMTTTTKKAPRTIRTADQVTLACHADYIAAKALDELLLAIARDTLCLSIDSFAEARADSKDFHEVYIPSLRNALASAYRAGVAAANSANNRR